MNQNDTEILGVLSKNVNKGMMKKQKCDENGCKKDYEAQTLTRMEMIEANNEIEFETCASIDKNESMIDFLQECRFEKESEKIKLTVSFFHSNFSLFSSIYSNNLFIVATSLHWKYETV